jgi:hypothetical protein
MPLGGQVKLFTICWAFATLLAFSPSWAKEPTDKKIGEGVSIIQLVANPDRYHGKLVYFRAYATVRFEGNSLCMTPDRINTKDCLWLQYDDGPWKTDKDMERYKTAQKKWEGFNGKVIFVRGIFNKKNTGHFGLFAGALERIMEVSEWQPQREQTVDKPPGEK